MSRFYNLEQAPFNNRASARSIVAANNGLIYNIQDLSTLYQDAAGTIPVTAAGQPVGKVLDISGNGNHATQPITAARPTLVQINGLYALSFDGIDDYLNIPYLGLYAGGACSIVAAIDSQNQTTNAALISERNSTVATQQYIPSRRVASDGIDALIINDAGTTVKDTNGTTSGLRTKTVRSIIDNGQNINIYKEGVLSGYDNYTRSGSLTLNNTTIGASISTTNSMFMKMNLFGLIVVKSALNDTQRQQCEKYLGRKVNVPIYDPITAVDSIGVPGEAFFGVGRVSRAPSGYTELTGDDNYGNYQYSDGSVQVCIPQFWERYGHIDNPTYAQYGVNSVDIKPRNYFASEAIANAAGYAINRMFIDGNQHKPVLFIDKYMCSNNGGIASSIKNGNPLSTAANHNPISELTGAPSNTYGGCWQAAKTRGANFFVASRFIYAALALLSLAHGQAATATTNCAWYDATGVSNFPKGCNNNALKDTNDTAVTYTSDGYSNCGKTGSGVPFSKTTHNGQACGIADLNGLMWEVSQGVTCIATSKTITAATQTNPVALTITAHGMTTGKEVLITSIAGMTQLNDKIYIATVVDANTITLNGVDGTAFTAYTSGGSATYGTFYVAKESAQMANFTGGNSLSTDHFGSVGVAANMDAFTPAFATTYSSNGFAQKLGNSANQALSPDLTGNNAVLRSLGIPIAAGMSTSGSNLFGQDYFYQYIRNELCLRSGATWNLGSNAGVWASNCADARTNSFDNVGFRSASYPVSEWGSDDA
jgi:hypothetical protein